MSASWELPTQISTVQSDARKDTTVQNQVKKKTTHSSTGTLITEMKLCPAGKYGSETGLTTATCSGECSAGYYCPAGSINNRANECGSVDKYCPAGSGAPTPVPSVFCSGPLSSSESTRSSVFSPDAYHVCVGARFHFVFSFIHSLYMRIHFTDSLPRRLCSSGSMTLVNEYPNPSCILSEFFIASNFTERVVDVSSSVVDYSNGTLSFLIPPESVSNVVLLCIHNR